MVVQLFRRRPASAAAVSVGFFLSLLILFSLYWSATPASVGGLTSAAAGLKTTSKALINDITNATLGFGGIFAISLPSRTDHRDALVLTSAVTNLKVDLVDGVRGEDVADKALPLGNAKTVLRPAQIGSWRAHMNAISRVVEQNLSSALIIEDDVDWDIRIRPQLHDFALSARTLTQPLLSQPNTYADPTYLDPSARKPDEIPFSDLPLTMPPAISPYGDNWDILWLGHCAMRAPNTLTPENASKSAQVPKGLVVHSHDPTVPETQHLHNFFENSSSGLVATYPNHTRIIHHFMGGWCSLAYAVTQTGARKLLYELGVTRISDTFDNMLREVCQGTDGREKLMCLTVQPPLFEHYRAEGSTGKMSDITDHGDEVIERGYTENIRLSTRVNLAKLINGETDYVDQWEDAP